MTLVYRMNSTPLQPETLLEDSKISLPDPFEQDRLLQEAEDQVRHRLGPPPDNCSLHAWLHAS